MLNIDYLNLKSIFSSVATVATARKLSKENFLLHLKECDLDIILKLHRKTYIKIS